MWGVRFVIGQRTISRHPESAEDDQRWRGTIDNATYQGRRWSGPHVESVIGQMDKDLGPIEEAHYTVTE